MPWYGTSAVALRRRTPPQPLFAVDFDDFDDFEDDFDDDDFDDDFDDVFVDDAEATAAVEAGEGEDWEAEAEAAEEAEEEEAAAEPMVAEEDAAASLQPRFRLRPPPYRAPPKPSRPSSPPTSGSESIAPPSMAIARAMASSVEVSVASTALPFPILAARAALSSSRTPLTWAGRSLQGLWPANALPFSKARPHHWHFHPDLFAPTDLCDPTDLLASVASFAPRTLATACCRT